MTVGELSILYNIIFIVILAIVCFIFSRIHLKIAERFTQKRLLFTSIYFIAITFSTIILWQITVNIIT